MPRKQILKTALGAIGNETTRRSRKFVERNLPWVQRLPFVARFLPIRNNVLLLAGKETKLTRLKFATGRRVWLPVFTGRNRAERIVFLYRGGGFVFS